MHPHALISHAILIRGQPTAEQLEHLSYTQRVLKGTQLLLLVLEGVQPLKKILKCLLLEGAIPTHPASHPRE